MRPLLLDMFCGAGGACKGYQLAGFDVVGIDSDPQPNYPGEFIQTDFRDADVSGYDAIHASPPCQAFTAMLANSPDARATHDDFVAPAREMLVSAHVPYVIENVVGAPLIDPIMLCGVGFGLKVIRHRLFETNFRLPQPRHRKHKGHVIRKRGDGGTCYSVCGHDVGSAEDWGDAMGIDWMKTKRELSQSIPPKYTEYIGGYLLNAVARKRKVFDATIGAQ